MRPHWDWVGGGRNGAEGQVKFLKAESEFKNDVEDVNTRIFEIDESELLDRGLDITKVSDTHVVRRHIDDVQTEGLQSLG